MIATAKDGCEALDQTLASCPDVLVLDIRMPRLSGLAVLQAIREARIRVIVIVLTNQDEPVYRKKLLAAGADYFLAKATQICELERIIQEMVFRSKKQE